MPTGLISVCSYCGSVHPADLAYVVRAGYGLVPAASSVLPEIFHLSGPGEYGRFLVLHLQDAQAEDRQVLERAMGLNFNFAGTNVSVTPYDPGCLPSG